MKETIRISELTASTYSIKDDSPRGCKTVERERVKCGDYVVIDNHFTLVVSDQYNKKAIETKIIVKYAENSLNELRAEYENPKCEQHSTHIQNLLYSLAEYHAYVEILSDHCLEEFLRIADNPENKKLVNKVNEYIKKNY